MATLRLHRAARGQSNAKLRKKTHVRKEWDNSVNDLTAHRATPEELVHRHEIHKSKNQWLAHWEVQKKALRPSSKKQTRANADSWAEKRYDLMRKILQEQYNLTDVLEDSDRALAVVKDLFGDAPRRRAGDPNVTLAPSCDLETSCGPIVRRKDPPTRLSMLSQSIMDSQALNETEPSCSRSEQSDDELELCVSSQAKTHTRSDPHPVHGGDTLTHSQLWLKGEKMQTEEEFVTPCRATAPLPHDQRALNATTAVKKAKVRRSVEKVPEREESDSMIGRVLNNLAGERRRHARGKGISSVSGPPAAELPGCNTSSLDILNLMTQDVERELAEYEEQTGREMTPAPRAQGLTGFTFSLVNSVRRLVFYLKESDRQLQQEIQERRGLQQELKEQRMLIDALTAELFTIKGILSDHSEMEDNLTALPEAAGNLPAMDRGTAGPPASTQAVHDQDMLDASGTTVKRTRVMERVNETTGEMPKKDQVDAALSTEQRASAGASRPAFGFLAAVMLSPPRQESRRPFRHQPTLLDNPVPSSPKTRKSSNQENLGALHGVTETLTAPRDHDRLDQDAGSRGSLEASQTIPHPAGQETESQALVNRHEDRRPGMPHSDIWSRLAELKPENSARESNLQQTNWPAGKPGSQVRQKDGDASPGACSDTKGRSSEAAQTSLESRIAELNRQSAEAREKLLNLIQQQKQTCILSPEISPITPQSSAGRRLEVSIPMPALNDSSLDETPSLASRSSGRRSASSRTGSLNTSGGAGRHHSAGLWTKVGREKDEGWFSLSAHVC
uniref:Spindle and centriole-associated protein 1 n=1 Tax=Leptobrachium leishanense TaxID=445787 RepID=A0A8C5LVH4_9ANUR